ncbi:unnamed protein product [Mucor fragilis]
MKLIYGYEMRYICRKHESLGILWHSQTSLGLDERARRNHIGEFDLCWRKTCDNNVHTEIVIDVQYVYDQEQTYVDYIKSYFVDIYDAERVKVEIRPRVDSKDSVIPSLSRSIVASGTRLADLVDDLQAEWFKPGQSYAQQTVHLFSDTPTPNHILGAKPPTSIQVSTDAAQHSSPATVEADLGTTAPANATAAAH